MFRNLLVVVTCAGITVSAFGDEVYMHQYGSGDILRYDTDTGQLTLVGNTILNGFVALAASPVPVPKAGGGSWPAGTLFGLERNDGNLYVIDKADASLTFIGSDPDDLAGSQGLAFNGAGELYALRDGDNDGEFFQVSTETGSGTYLGYSGEYDLDGLTVFPTDTNVQGFGVAQAGDFLACNGYELYHIEPGTLNATYIGQSMAHQTLDFSPQGTLYSHDWSAGGLYVTTLDPLGDSFLATVGSNVDGMAVIPEPSSLLLLGTCVLLGATRRR